MTTRRIRPPWRSPVGALLLAAASVMLGLTGRHYVTAEPSHEIEFLVDEAVATSSLGAGLAPGITQHAVEAAAQGVALSHRPLAVAVMERELEWDEYRYGEFDIDADVLISVGIDPMDPDTVLADTTRVAFRGQEIEYSDAEAIRESFINNQTLGHGPQAVVGAALTAADLLHGSGPRSPAIWASAAALPITGAIVVMFLWVRDLNLERRRVRELARAQLQLARTVLELEALYIRFDAAHQVLSSSSNSRAQKQLKNLESEWETIRGISLALAREESGLQEVFRNGGRSDDFGSMEEAVEALESFVRRSETLKRRADALADAAEFHAGHAGSQRVLDRLAQPLFQAIDEILVAAELFPDSAKQLQDKRDQLLSLTHEAAAHTAMDSLDSEESEVNDFATDQSDLLGRWNQTEQDIRKICNRIISALEKRRTQRGDLQAAAREHEQARIRRITGGEVETFQELRRSLRLERSRRRVPQHRAEVVLVALEEIGAIPQRAPLQDTGKKEHDSKKGEGLPLHVQGLTAAVLLGAPVLMGVAVGWLAAADHAEASRTSTIGLDLEGDRPLAGLEIYGDVATLPDLTEKTLGVSSHEESMTLSFVNEHMERSAESSPDFGLFLEDVTLTVALVPAEDYFDPHTLARRSERLDIGYVDLLPAQQRLKEDVGDAHPDLIDPATGAIASGEALLPVWLLDEESYAVGYTLTGEISSGVDSAMGRYYFLATEPGIRSNAQGNNRPLGWKISNDMQSLAKAMEHNHQQRVTVSTQSVFWMVAISTWAGSQTVALTGVAATETLRRRLGTREARRELGQIRSQLNELALGLDLSRLNMVAVLGGDSASQGRAEESDQRLFESTLATAWRQVQSLERAPRREQRGTPWHTSLHDLQHLVANLSSRDLRTADRASDLLRTQRNNL